jgi:hypothetical protein
MPEERSMLNLLRALFQKHWLVLTTVGWLFLLPVAICIQFHYDSVPGIASAPKSSWPPASKIRYSTTTNTLVMVLHPRCPCSRASLQQVATMRNSRNPLKVVFLFYTPSGFSKGWEKTDIWRQASEIPDAELISDVDGRETQKFGGVTSGQTYIFDRQGLLRYSGGLTEGRGHPGECQNLETAVKALNDSNSPATFGAVYGCPIVDSKKAQL